MEKIILEKYYAGVLKLPSVVDSIQFERHVVLDIFIHKDQMFKKDQELEYNGQQVIVEKKIRDTAITTEAEVEDRTRIRKCRFYCRKKFL